MAEFLELYCLHDPQTQSICVWDDEKRGEIEDDYPILFSTPADAEHYLLEMMGRGLADPGHAQYQARPWIEAALEYKFEFDHFWLLEYNQSGEFALSLKRVAERRRGLR